MIGAGRARRIRQVVARQPIGLPFCAPYLVYVIAIFAYPLGLAGWMSCHEYFFTAPGVSVPRPFVGLGNFRTVLSDPAVLQSFRNVLIFLVVNVPVTVALSLTLAVALNRALPFRTFFRVSYYLPYITASVAVVGVWRFLFSSDGLVNRVLGSLAPTPSWLINERWVMPSVALFVAWKQCGFFILLYLAALQNVSPELYEAAMVDGASAFRRFWAVTVPAVSPVTTLVTLLATVTGANLFTEPYLLTGGGGPYGHSTSPVLVMYQRGFEQGHPDLAAAIGVILVGGVLAVAGLRRLIVGRPT